MIGIPSEKGFCDKLVVSRKRGVLRQIYEFKNSGEGGGLTETSRNVDMDKRKHSEFRSIKKMTDSI